MFTLFPPSQTAAFFDGHVAYDNTDSGMADSLDERERLFFEALMRVLDRELPGYRDWRFASGGPMVANARRRKPLRSIALGKTLNLGCALYDMPAQLHHV
jgi:hypothetical protein